MKNTEFISRVPESIRNKPIWVCYHEEPDKNGECHNDGSPKMKKLPRSAHNNRDVFKEDETGKRVPLGYSASTKDSRTWDTLENCFESLSKNRYNHGLGVVLADTNPDGAVLVGIDIDNVRDSRTGVITNPEAQKVLDMFPETYCELSPSQSGFHIYLYAKLDKKLKVNKVKLSDGMELETYFTAWDGVSNEASGGRYFTFTGNKVIDTDQINDCTEAFKTFLKTYFPEKNSFAAGGSWSMSAAHISFTDEQIIDLASNGIYRSKFEKLFKNGDISGFEGDDSRADLALCNIIAYYTTDPEQINRIFKKSALYRDPERIKKWNRHDYAFDMTIKKALESPQAGKFMLLNAHHPVDYTDTQVGQVFSECYKDCVRFCPKLKQYVVYDGKSWVMDDSNRVLGYFHEMIYVNRLDLEEQLKTLFKDVTELEGELDKSNDNLTDEQIERLTDEIKTKKKDLETQIKAVKAKLRDCKKYENNKGIQGALAQAKAYNGIDSAEFDAEPDLLNTPDGILKISTGEYEEHNPELKCSRITSRVSGNNEPLWNDFLNYVTSSELCPDGNEEYKEYLQVLCGSSLIGGVYEEGIFIAHGSGGNGKSTFFNAIAKVMGSYATTIKADIFTTEYRGNRDTELVKLRGRRLAIASELEPDSTFAIGLLKQSCSRDVITARGLYKEAQEWKPSHTLILMCNHIPHIPSNYKKDDGTIDRLHVLPFEGENMRHTSEEVKDLETKLVTECGECIFQWLVTGAQKFIEQGYKLNPIPIHVMEYTQEQLGLTDSVSRFIKQMTSPDPNDKVQSSQLYSAYTDYCRYHGLTIEDSKVFKSTLGKMGYFWKKTNKGRYFNGLQLMANLKA